MPPGAAGDRSDPPAERFVSAPIRAHAAAADADGPARGEPGLPPRFTWNDSELEVVEVLSAWKEGGDGLGGGHYLRRHWWRVRDQHGRILTVYFERQARSAAAAHRRWFLYTVSEPPSAAD